MQVIKAVLFDPVGSLAEFSAEPFHAIAARALQKEGTGASGSEAYWNLLTLMEESGSGLTTEQRRIAEALEIEAVEHAHVYEDVGPALTELNSMGIILLIASSLSATAVSHFLDGRSLRGFFSAVWSRDNAGGVGATPLRKAIEDGPCPAEHVMALADTTAGLQVAKDVGANAILMINDYEDGKRLAAHAPAGAIVSLHELPDAIRFVAEGAKVPRR